jgi:multidrug resistance efflux pump
MHVSGLGLVQVEAGCQERVVAPSPGGFLVQTFARKGQYVKKGDILAVFRNPKLDLDLRLNEADRTLRFEQLQSLTAQLALDPDPGSDWDSRAEIQQELHTLAQQHATYSVRAHDLVVRAPRDGMLLSFPSWDVLGKWLPEGTPLCQIGDDRQLRLLVLLEPANRQLVETGKSIRFRCHGVSDTTWHGTVSGVSQTEEQDIPVQLSQRFGGDVASKPDPVAKTELPETQHYLISAGLANVDHRLQIGTIGQVRIDAGWQTCWDRFRRYLGATFHWGL